MIINKFTVCCLLLSLLNASVSGLVELKDNKIYVDGSQFFIRGVNYSPVPMGENVEWYPKGDYFTVDYAYQWQRDLPLIKAMGANTIRLYAWNNDLNHSPFLDVAHSVGLKVILTYYVSNKFTPVATDAQAIIDGFSSQVAKYADHPAVLMWIFGNELNGDWNGFLDAFSDIGGCGWISENCFNKDSTVEPCLSQSRCVYNQFFGWINQALKSGKSAGGTNPPLMSASFADVDQLASQTPSRDKIALYGSLLPDLDVYSVQLYRGQSFGSYFTNFGKDTTKLVLVSEYGVDAYNDPCGWQESGTGPCRNTANDGKGGATASDNFIGCIPGNNVGKACSVPGEVSQAQYDSNLATELEAASFVKGGSAAGGLIMAWIDEYWKGQYSNNVCIARPCPITDVSTAAFTIQQCLASPDYAIGGSAGCMPNAHVSCNDKNVQYQDLCGGINHGFPDGYSNEEWYGLNSITQCANKQDSQKGHTLYTIKPRPVINSLASIWGGDTGKISSLTSGQTCDSLNSCWDCSANSDIDWVRAGNCADRCNILNVVKVFPSSSHSFIFAHNNFFAMFITLCTLVLSIVLL